VKLLDVVGWLLFFGAGLLLWASGVLLFVKSDLSPAKKLGWTAFLVAAGAAIGSFLPLSSIRNRFLLLLAVLPVLAVVDVRLARSNRSFWFWFRACAFEVCTVFGSAAITRAVLGWRPV
jgi:hypothetical protein